MGNNPNKPDGSSGSSTPEKRPPFNELSVLFPLLTIYTVVYMALMTVEFFLHGALKAPARMMPVYIALVAAYAADKEIRRWAGATEPARKGSIFVYLWLLFFMGASMLAMFRPEFVLPADLDLVAMQVLGIFFGSKASKVVHDIRQARTMTPAELESREAQVLELIRARGRITRKEVMAEMRISHTTANRILSEMEKGGLIRRGGDNKGTFYILNPSSS